MNDIKINKGDLEAYRNNYDRIFKTTNPIKWWSPNVLGPVTYFETEYYTVQYDSGWYFYDEASVEVCGPFETRANALDAQQAYFREVSGGLVSS